MSIRGIDTQIMITRSSDFVRETSNIQKHPEVTQEHLAAQAKIESDVDQSRVLATTEAENENIRTDVDEEREGSAGGEGSGQSSQEEDDTGEVAPELRVAPAAYDQLIDIVV